MKHLILIWTILNGFLAVSQDPVLPQERVTIILNNGNTLKDVRLWSCSDGILEYEANQVLRDVRLDDISQIKGNFVYEISDSASGIKSLASGADKPFTDMNSQVTQSDSIFTHTDENVKNNNFIAESDNKTVEKSSTPLTLVSNKNYFSLGQSDAKKYYKKGNDLKVIRKMAENPNLLLLQSNGEYHRGFMSEIKRQKTQSAIITMLLIIFPILIIAAAA